MPERLPLFTHPSFSRPFFIRGHKNRTPLPDENSHEIKGLFRRALISCVFHLKPASGKWSGSSVQVLVDEFRDKRRCLCVKNLPTGRDNRPSPVGEKLGTEAFNVQASLVLDLANGASRQDYEVHTAEVGSSPFPTPVLQNDPRLLQ